jgi:monoamine oxidase
VQRVGGRTLNIQVGEDAWDGGAGWIGAQQPLVKGLCDKLGIATYPQHDEGKHILLINGKVSTYTGNISSLNRSDLGELEQVVQQWDELMLKARHLPSFGRPCVTASRTCVRVRVRISARERMHAFGSNNHYG